MVDFIAWHNRALSEHEALRTEWALKGYRFLSLSIYGSVGNPYYAAVMIKRAKVVAQRDWPCLTAAQWQATFNSQATQGYGPVILAATGSASDPRFAAVFEPQNPIPLTRHGLGLGSVTDSGTIQGMNNIAKNDGLILRWAASYGSNNDPAFAAIWKPNTHRVLWNNDGLLDDADTYQARFDAETSVWCRPGFVTLNADNSYLSLFVADEIGPWVARHNMTAAEYQTEFDTWTAQGYFPGCVQAAGASENAALFAALFVKSEHIVERQFSATGPVTNSAVDQQVRNVMGSHPGARHASLAIVKGRTLVYARGYTLAEPDWPIAHPTTYFRLASVSKTVVALAIFQLIEESKLKLSDTLQSVLDLVAPSGGPPTDPRFSNITIRHLLEHTSGVEPGASSDGVAVVAAFQAAGQPAQLPVTQEMTDSYIASLSLVSDPGAVQAYNNCGYYLLGRVVAHLRGKKSPIDAYAEYLLRPLGITRMRSSVDLVSEQLQHEARYQAAAIDSAFPSDLQVDSSQMTPDQPLVAAGYGDEELAIGQGAGGLSAATPDVARLIAILIDQNDNSALKRATIAAMLSDAAALTAAGNQRAGYGLDSAVNQGGGSFYGQKGGELINAAGILQFNGEWGFALFFGSPAQIPGVVPSWYPNFDAMMNIAKNTTWGAADLFPDFGMPSL